MTTHTFYIYYQSECLLCMHTKKNMQWIDIATWYYMRSKKCGLFWNSVFWTCCSQLSRYSKTVKGRNIVILISYPTVYNVGHNFHAVTENAYFSTSCMITFIKKCIFLHSFGYFSSVIHPIKLKLSQIVPCVFCFKFWKFQNFWRFSSWTSTPFYLLILKFFDFKNKA